MVADPPADRGVRAPCKSPPSLDEFRASMEAEVRAVAREFFERVLVRGEEPAPVAPRRRRPEWTGYLPGLAPSGRRR